MIELLIFPLATGMVITCIEHFIIVPYKEKQNINTNSIKSIFVLNYFLALFAGIIIFELIIRPFFPKLNIPSKLLEGILKDSNIAFASIFYVCTVCVFLSFQSKSKYIYFIFTHLIPYLCLIWWTFTFPNVFKILESTTSQDTIMPIIHNIILCWLFYGLKIFFPKKALEILAIVVFPLNALFLLNCITAFDAWVSALFTMIFMYGISDSTVPIRQHLKDN